jgi:hypothetical protein
MPAISTTEAVQRLTQEVRENLDTGHFLEIHNELFPSKAVTMDEAFEDPTLLMERIVAEINRGLEPDEIVELWRLVFGNRVGAWYDETDGLLHYRGEVDMMYPG